MPSESKHFNFDRVCIDQDTHFSDLEGDYMKENQDDGSETKIDERYFLFLSSSQKTCQSS